MISNPRFINALVSIICILSLLAILGCGNSEREAKIKNLNNRITALESQRIQLNQKLDTAKSNQGLLRNLFSDNEEVKALKEKIKKVESEIAATEKELATLTGDMDNYNRTENLVEMISIFIENKINK